MYLQQCIDLLMHVKEDVASALPPLSNVLLSGLIHMAVIVATPHPITGTAHITDVVTCNTVASSRVMYEKVCVANTCIAKIYSCNGATHTHTHTHTHTGQVYTSR